MKFLLNAASRLPEFRQLDEAVAGGALPAAVTGLATVHKAHFIAALCRNRQRRALVLAGDESEAQRLCGDLEAMGLRPLFYPYRDFALRDAEGASHEYERQRLQVLALMAADAYDVAVACPDAALQYTIPPQELRRRTVTLRPGQQITMEAAEAALLACGYERAVQVDGSGQFSRRGGILDVFPPDNAQPARLEFWGDEIDTISTFDVETQRRADPLEELLIAPAVEALADDPAGLAAKIRKLAGSLRGKSAAQAKETLLGQADRLEQGLRLGCLDKFITLLYGETATLFDYAKDDLVFLSESARCRERVRSTLWQWGEDVKGYLEDGVLCRSLAQFSEDWPYLLSRFEPAGIYLDVFARGGYDTPVRTQLAVTARQLAVWGGSTQLLTEDLQAMLHNKWSCVVLAGNERSARTVAADLQAAGLPAAYLEDPETVQRGTVAVTPEDSPPAWNTPPPSWASSRTGAWRRSSRKSAAARRTARRSTRSRISRPAITWCTCPTASACSRASTSSTCTAS